MTLITHISLIGLMSPFSLRVRTSLKLPKRARHSEGAGGRSCGHRLLNRNPPDSEWCAVAERNPEAQVAAKEPEALSCRQTLGARIPAKPWRQASLR
jgi:hypothetical protein